MNDIVLTLRGEKVGLGPLREDLIPTYTRWWNDPEVMLPNAAHVWPCTEQEQRTWYEKAALRGDGSAVHFLAYELATMRPLGVFTLFGINYRAQTAWASSFIGEKDCWGHGFATEARRLLLRYGFNVLGLHYVCVGIHADNIGSLRVAEKVGYKRVGVQRQAVRKNGGYIDAILMDILPEDLKESL